MPGSDPVDSLVLDLLEWIGGEPHPHGLIKRRRWTASGPRVSVSSSGAHYLRTHRRRSP